MDTGYSIRYLRVASGPHKHANLWYGLRLESADSTCIVVMRTGQRRCRCSTAMRFSSPQTMATRSDACATVFETHDLLCQIAAHLHFQCVYVPEAQTLCCDQAGDDECSWVWSTKPERHDLIGGASYAAFCKTSKPCNVAMKAIASTQFLALWPSRAYLPSARASDSTWHGMLCLQARSLLAFYDEDWSARSSLSIPRGLPFPDLSSLDNCYLEIILEETSIEKRSGRREAVFVGCRPLGDTRTTRRLTRQSSTTEGYFEMENAVTRQAAVEQLSARIMFEDEPLHDALHTWHGEYKLSIFLTCGLSCACLAAGDLPHFRLLKDIDYSRDCPGESILIDLVQTEWMRKYGGSMYRFDPSSGAQHSDFLIRDVELSGRLISGLRPGHPLWIEQTMRKKFDERCSQVGSEANKDREAALCLLHVETAGLAFNLPQTQQTEPDDVPTDDQVMNALALLRWTS